MEKLNKIHLLVDRLQTLTAENASKEKLITTTQMLLAELQFSSESQQHLNNVCIVLPGQRFSSPSEPEIVSKVETPPIIEEKETVSLNIEEEKPEIFPLKEEKILSLKEEIVSPNSNDLELGEPTIEEPKAPHPFIRDDFNIWSTYTESTEVPTLVQNKPATVQVRRELNESLKQEEVELGQTLQSTPIENLSAAIGINDRYLYISELFRGDEAMYERSILTINKFNNYEQAHTWVERELRLKLGWDIENDVTIQFEQLIKRRFIRKD